MTKIPYYWVKSGRAYWRPNKRMMSLGFGCVSLGIAGAEAEEQAQLWNARWQAQRKDPDEISKRRLRIVEGGDAAYVYFLQIADRIKIGSSRSPLTRIQRIAAGSHSRPARVLVVAGNRADEKRLHTRFKAYHTNGEWFVASHPLLLTISRCAMAGQVVHDGPNPGTNRVPRVESPDFRVESEGWVG